MEHECSTKYNFSSKNMETATALECVIKIHTNLKGEVFVQTIISDNDNTMRAILEHKSSNTKKLLPDYTLNATFFI